MLQTHVQGQKNCLFVHWLKFVFGSTDLLVLYHNIIDLSISSNLGVSYRYRIRNSFSFLPNCEKRGTLMGSIFFGIFLCQQYGENGASYKKSVHLKSIKTGF